MRHSKRMLYSDKWSEEEGQTNHKEDLRKHPETPCRRVVSCGQTNEWVRGGIPVQRD